MTKVVFLGLISVLLFASTTAAVEPGDTLWTRTYGGIYWDGARCVQQTTDRGYIVAGYTYPFAGVYNNDFYLIKTDASGDTLWTRTYGGSWYDDAYSIQQTTDGGYIVVGLTSSFGAGHFDFYLVRADASGNTLWTRVYGGPYEEYAWSVQQTSDGGYVVAGGTKSFGAGERDFYLLKTDAVGDTLWARTYGGIESDWAYSVQQTSDGGYIIAGYTASFGAGSADVWLLKTDAAGDTVWTRTYGGTESDGARSVQQTADGGYIIAGKTYSFGAGGQDFYLVKTDSLGSVEWQSTYGGNGDDHASSIQQTTDGGYILAGYTDSFGAGLYDLYLVKTDAFGDTLWTRTYGGSDDDMANSVKQTSDGSYIIAGFTNSFGAGETDCWLLLLSGEQPAVSLTIVPGDTVVAHNDTLCYHLICQNHTPDYLSLSFKVDVRLPNGQMYGPIFGPARFGMFGNGISEGDMCHRVPPPAPLGDYWLFAEVYNLEVSARDSMAFTITGDGEFAELESPFGDWQTVVARMGDEDLIGEGVETGLPAQFALQSNYPNPFNARTVINYELPTLADVKLEVFNLLGEKVATLVDGEEQAGYRSAVWDASEVSSGLYFYKLTAGDFTETKRMMLVK